MLITTSINYKLSLPDTIFLKTNIYFNIFIFQDDGWFVEVTDDSLLNLIQMIHENTMFRVLKWLSSTDIIREDTEKTQITRSNLILNY